MTNEVSWSVVLLYDSWLTGVKLMAWRMMGILVGLGLLVVGGVLWFLIRFWNQQNPYAPWLIVMLVVTGLLCAAAAKVGPAQVRRRATPRPVNVSEPKPHNVELSLDFDRHSQEATRLRSFIRRLAELDRGQWEKVASSWRLEGRPAYRALWFQILRSVVRAVSRRSSDLDLEMTNAVVGISRQLGLGTTEIAAAVDACFAVLKAPALTRKKLDLFYAPFEPFIPFTSLTSVPGGNSISRGD